MTPLSKHNAADDQITPAQCRAARGMLQWSQTELARRAKVARKTVADFEQEIRKLRRRSREAITETIERAGVHFIWDDGGQVVCVAADKATNLHSARTK
jgi:DNA-binding XRE family transcriptional regulator